LNSVEIIESLIKDLISGDDQLAESALLHLAQMGEVALEYLLQLLDSNDPDQRWWAVRSLSNFKTPLVSEKLVSALSDPDSSVQHCAALSLRYAPTPIAIPSLIKTLQSNDNFLARLAGDALTAIGKEAIPSLTEALHSTHAAVRGEAARALAKMELPDTIPALYSAVEDSSAIVQYWADDGLERLGVGMIFFKP